MAWFFEGRTDKIALNLSEAGQWSVHGIATQDCRPDSGTFEILGHVQGLVAHCSIHSIEDAERHYDGLGRGLKKFFEGNGGKSAAVIQYFGDINEKKTGIGLNVVMPPELAARSSRSEPSCPIQRCATSFAPIFLGSTRRV